MRDDAAIPALLLVWKEPGILQCRSAPFPLKNTGRSRAFRSMTHMEMLISFIKEQCPDNVNAFRVLYGNRCYANTHIHTHARARARARIHVCTCDIMDSWPLEPAVCDRQDPLVDDGSIAKNS